MTEAVEHVETVLSEVIGMRKNIDVHFKEIFSKSEQLLASVNNEEMIKIPRIVSHQKNIINIDTKVPENYFRYQLLFLFMMILLVNFEKDFQNTRQFYPLCIY